MVSDKAGLRRAMEDTIEHLIAILDLVDGDADLELEPIDEQHDLEPDAAIVRAPVEFVLAEMVRRRAMLQ